MYTKLIKLVVVRNMPSIVYDQNTDSLSDSMVNIDYGEIKAGLIGALESRKSASRRS